VCSFACGVFDRLRREHSLKQLDLFVLVLQPTLQLDHLLRTVGAIASVRQTFQPIRGLHFAHRQEVRIFLIASY